MISLQINQEISMQEWDSLVLRRGDLVCHALQVIDAGSVKTAFVVDNNGTLLGSITDGDIRRGLLRNIAMDDHVVAVMNPKPIFCLASDSTAHIIDKLISNDIQCMPIIDAGCLVGIKKLKDLQKPQIKENPVFIMAGGFGTRLSPLTDKCPKPMLPVGQKPMLEHIITRIASQGFINFYISTHYLPDIIIDYFGGGDAFGVNISYVNEAEPLGTGGALGMLPTDLPDLPVIMLNGDVLTDLNFNRYLDFHNQNDFDATMCLREIEYQVSYGVVETNGNLVSGMKEKPAYIHDINTGIYCLSRKFVKKIESGYRIDMPTFLENRMKQGDIVGVYRHAGYWLDIGKMTDYQKAQRDIMDLMER